LQRLKALAPDHGRAHQEEGHTCRDAGRLDDALQAYARATHFNPALVAAWRELAKILRDRSMVREAERVESELQQLQALPAPLLAATDLIAQGRLLKAEDIVRQFLGKVPHHVAAMRLLADIGIRFGVLDDAEFLLEAAVRFEPDNVPARIDYIQALRKRQKFREALREARILLDSEPENLRFQSVFAVECMQTGDYDTALSTFDRILAKIPGDPVTLTSRGHALKTCGRYDEAVSSYRAAVTGQPRYGEAWYSLANLKVYAFDDSELQQMRAQDEDPNLSYLDRVYLNFALGKACEDRSEFDTAFDYYRRGNALKKGQSRYDADEMSADLLAQRAVCTRQFFEERSDFGHAAPDPIFIVGLPRAGSTLLEQILSSHSQVDGTLELPNVLSLSQTLRRRARKEGTSYPDILAELGPEELAEFGQRYIEETRVHRQGSPFFVDKMPNNFRHLGLIRLMLPNARIIDARRHPMACCFSAWKQLFAEGQEFSYDLNDTGRYYSDYFRLMAHWDDVLPGFVLRVLHADVVDDLEGQVRRMLDFCGLPFEGACLEFFKTERNVRTPSSEQVRQPINRSGLELWQQFAGHLAPLKNALGRDVRRQFDLD
jgi:tetratricopeptide (TPR) repeat protein